MQNILCDVDSSSTLQRSRKPYYLFRLFSGDENGKIIVHDFLQFDEGKDVS
jgi:hypothetical protein